MENEFSKLPPPGRNGIKFDHFPTKMQAFIFRNWDIVPKERIAAALGCGADKIEDEAFKMGLSPQGNTAIWLERGYIPIIKLNWSLIPYDQLLTLLDWSEDKLSMVLKDEDFLKFKLGDIKPDCEKVTYAPLTESQEEETKLIKSWIEDNFPKNPKAKEPFDFSYEIRNYPAKVSDITGKILVDSSWGIEDNTNDETAGKIISRFKKGFEKAWGISLDGNEKKIVFSFFDVKKEEEYHEINITEDKIQITGADSSAILRGLVYLEDIANSEGGMYFKPSEVKRKARFKTRMIYSFSGLYNDALDVPGESWCPDSLLENYSKSGVNAIWLQGILYRLAHFPFDPSFSEGMEERLERLRILVRRCREYGIKVFLYLNEPRAMHDYSFDKFPHIRGAKLKQRCLCTSHPEVQKYLFDAVKSVCESVPGLGGIFTISASENNNNCHAWVMDEPCPVCSKKPLHEIIGLVNDITVKAAHSANPDLKVIVWDWGWRREILMHGEDVEKCIKSMDPGAIIMSGRERGIPIKKGGIEGEIEDYTLCTTGIGEMAKDAWKWAKESGHETAAKLQINNTWECSTMPYLPVFKTVSQIIEDVEKEDVQHLMLSWTLGGAPSPNIKVVSQSFFETEGEGEAKTDICKAIYGDDAKKVKKATDLFSDALYEFPFEHSGLYQGPANNGAANLLYDYKTEMTATMTCYSYDDIEHWSSIYPVDIFENQYVKMVNLISEGLEILKDVKDEEIKTMARGMYIQFASSLNQIRFIRARDKGDSKTMSEIAKAEISLAKELYTLMDENPNIGFEAANQYYYTKGMLKEKIICCNQIIRKYS